MNGLNFRQSMWVAAAMTLSMNTHANLLFAADAAKFTGGDLKVDGIHFSADGNVVRKLTDLTSPWTILNPNIYYLTGNVGIGTMTPTQKLSVSGTIESTSGGFKFPDGTILTTSPPIIYPFGNSIALGSNALGSNTSGIYNTALGIEALTLNTTGGANTATGFEALYSNTTGNNNTATGMGALFYNTSGNLNTATGNAALAANTTGTVNTATGANALRYNTTGAGNTAHGASALYSNSTGSQNTAQGVNALNSNTVGYSNTAHGYNSLNFNTTGNSNTAVGDSALAHSTSGNGNSASGYQTLLSNTTGYMNTAHGYTALYSNTSGYQNTATGFMSLYYNSAGTANTAFGGTSLLNNTGSYNIGLGHTAGWNLTTGDNNIDIGNQGVAGESYTIRIGDIHTRTFISGIRGRATGINDAQPVVIDSAGQLGSALTLRVPGNGNWDLDGTEGDFTIGTSAIRLKIGVPTGGAGTGDIGIKADGGLSHLSLIAAGGTSIYTNVTHTSGVSIGAGSGAWSSVSDRAAKKDLNQIDAGAILDKVATLPLYTWRYISEVSGAQHIGPMAQDFYAAFQLGDSDKTITTVDADGIALAAIQALKAENEALKARLERLEKRLGM